MKGLTNYYGDDRLTFLLHNNGGNSESGVASADERIKTYGMQSFMRVRVDNDECDHTIAPMFNHFGYGYIVIDGDGMLRGSNLYAPEMSELVGKLLRDNEEEGDAPEFDVSYSVKKVAGGKSGFDLRNRLPEEQTSQLTLVVKLPAGYHIYGAGKGNPEPTKVSVAYHDGLQVGEALVLDAQGDEGGVQHVHGPARITLEVKAPKGTPIGNYFVHGTIHLMACNEHGCLPAMELPWTARVPLL